MILVYLYIDILVQPVSQLDVVPGQDAVFTVNTSRDGPTHQWQRDSVNLTDTLDQYSGSTTSSLTVLSVAESDEGNYTCVVTVSDGNSTTTDVAQLSVRECCVQLPFRVDCDVFVLGDLPVITADPVSQTDIVPGADATFSVTATGPPTLTYQWQRDGTDISDMAEMYPGPGSGSIYIYTILPTHKYSIYGRSTATNTLIVLGVTEEDEGNYTCVVSNGGRVTSMAAQLDVRKFALCT